MENPDFLAVMITYNSGTQAEFLAKAFDIDPERAVNTGRKNVPYKFTYTGVSGEEIAMYLTLTEVSGITVSERWD